MGDVTEYLTNLGKAPARPGRLGRCGVPETVSTDRRQSGPFARMPADCGDALAREPTMRGADPREHRLVRAPRPAPSQPADDRPADVDGNR